MQAILEAIDRGELNATVAVVFSNNVDAPALEIAKKHGVPTCALSNKGMTREQHEEQVLDMLKKFNFDFVVLAGYMRVLTSKFLRAYQHADGFFRIINIHPSMLPAFPGACAYDDAFEAKVKESGITIHLVDELVDHGPILAQESFERRDVDTIESFKARGLAVEHRLYPAVLQQISEEGIKVLVERHASPVVSKSGSSTK